jgi:hypothetical protein
MCLTSALRLARSTSQTHVSLSESPHQVLERRTKSFPAIANHLPGQCYKTTYRTFINPHDHNNTMRPLLREKCASLVSKWESDTRVTVRVIPTGTGVRSGIPKWLWLLLCVCKAYLPHLANNASSKNIFHVLRQRFPFQTGLEKVSSAFGR